MSTKPGELHRNDLQDDLVIGLTGPRLAEASRSSSKSQFTSEVAMGTSGLNGFQHNKGKQYQRRFHFTSRHPGFDFLRHNVNRDQDYLESIAQFLLLENLADYKHPSLAQETQVTWVLDKLSSYQRVWITLAVPFLVKLALIHPLGALIVLRFAWWFIRWG